MKKLLAGVLALLCILSLTVYLYNENDRSTPALQMTLPAGEAKSFTNLTSRYLYYLCFEPATSGTAIDVTISD